MFNAELKNKYLSGCKSKVNPERLFKKSRDYETAANLDLCQLDVETVNKLISYNSGYNIKTARTLISALRRYCLWCKEQGIDVNPDLLSIKNVDQTIGVKRSMVSSPSRLKSIMDYIFSRPDEQTDECLLKCFLWCAFFGVPTESVDFVCEVLKTDLDIEKGIIVVDNCSYEMYEESIPDFFNLKNLNAFAFRHPTYKSVVYRKRIQSDYLFRGLESGKSKTGHINAGTMISKIGSITRGGERTLRYSDIYLSGIFYRAFQLETEGFTPDFTKYIQSRFGDVDLSRLPRNSNLNSQRRISAQNWYRDLLTNYEVWKKAFRLI